MTAAIASLLLAQRASVLPLEPVKATVTSVASRKVAIPAPKAKATLLFFVGVDCPIANRMAPEMARIVKAYEPKGISAMLVYPSDFVKAAEVRKHIKEYAFTIPAIIDPKLRLTRSCGATMTPQAILLSPSGKVEYMGRINDQFEEHGKTNLKPKTHDLRNALDALLAGKKIENPITQPVGCYIG